MCGSERFKVLGRRLNTPQGLRPKKKVGISVTVMRCTDCGLIFPQPLPIPAQISDHYSVPAEDYWHTADYEAVDDHLLGKIERIKQLAPHTKTFLDIGAGTGIVMKTVPFDAYGIEPCEPFRVRAIEKLGIDPERIQPVGIEEAEFSDESFDCISFGVVLEHLYDPSASIRKALRWLTPNGIIHIEVPSSAYLFGRLFNLYFWLARTDFVVNISPMHVPYHIYEFTEKSFELGGQRDGYTVAHIDRYVGVPPVSGKAAKGVFRLLSPVMNATDTGIGLVVYLRKR